MSNELFYNFNICALNDKTDDILWLSLTHFQSKETFILCVRYLPPSTTNSRGGCSFEFFNQLKLHIFKYQELDKIFICGDFTECPVW